MSLYGAVYEENKRLRAELEQARKDHAGNAAWWHNQFKDIEAELEQTRKERSTLNGWLDVSEKDAQRYRASLERLRDDPSLGRLGRAVIDDALARKGQS